MNNNKLNRLLYELRIAGILPKNGETLNPEQQEIYNYVSQNIHTPKRAFISKYSHLVSPEYRMWAKTKQYVNKGSRRKQDFNITIDDIIIPTHCPLLGIKLSTDFKDRLEPHYYSIDRIDSSKGYIKGNVQILSMKANTMKSDATPIELVNFSLNVIKTMDVVKILNS